MIKLCTNPKSYSVYSLSKNYRIEKTRYPKCEGAQGGGARLALDLMSVNACIAGVCAVLQQIFRLSKKSVRTFLIACSILWELYQGPFPYVFPILSKCKFHGNCVFGILRSLEFLLLYCHEYFVRNNSFTRVRIEIPLHETNVIKLTNKFQKKEKSP